MVDKNVNNYIFVRLVMEIIENKYDIVFKYETTDCEDEWSNLTITFIINCHENLIVQNINYKTQKICDLVAVICDKINTAIEKSYLK